MARKTKAQIKEERKIEVEQILDEVKSLLSRICADLGVPRNIRKIGQESIDTLEKLDDKENSPAIVASTSVSLLEDIIQDLNCPAHTRTAIYQILSLLEQVRDY